MPRPLLSALILAAALAAGETAFAQVPAPDPAPATPDLKVMFITGFAAVALNPDNKTPKDAKVLSKPFHLRDLVNEVERLLKAA